MSEVSEPCSVDGCEHRAVVWTLAYDSEEGRWLCVDCNFKMALRLRKVMQEWWKLLEGGVNEKMAHRVLSERMDRGEL